MSRTPPMRSDSALVGPTPTTPSRSFAGLKPRWLRQAAAAAYTFLFAVIAPAMAADGPVFIDFERFPGPDGIIGTPDDIPAPSNCAPPPIGICGTLSNEFSSMGITFTSGTLFQGSFFPGSLPTNHFISSAPPDATLSKCVTGISITSYSVWTATLYALDENNNVIASDTLINPNAGSAFFLGTLNVSANRPIRRFTVLPAGCQIGVWPCNPILNLDDLVLIAPGPTKPTKFTPIQPCRAVDTRDASGPLGGPSLIGGQARPFVLTGLCGVPITAKALAANVTVVNPGSPGYLRLYPGDAGAPLSSVINFSPGQVRANNAVLALPCVGDGVIIVSNNAASPTHVVIDLNGYFE